MNRAMLRFLGWLSSKLQRREICAENGVLYLERFRIFGWTPGSSRRYPFSIYLHRFHLQDLDDVLHSHPWKWAISLVLAGGYTELRQDGEVRRLGAGSLNWLNGESFHRITKVEWRRFPNE